MDYAAARKHMVDSQVRTNDVTDLRLQAAMETAPRELFLPPGLKAQAYVEREISYAPGRRLLKARDFAKLVAAADPQPTDLVLDVACGSGYSAAILSRLADTVVAIEPDEEMVALAQANLAAIGAGNVAVVAGDPVAGAPSQGPFDLIFIGAAIEIEPKALLAQLKDGGRLAAFRRAGGVTHGVVYLRNGETASPRIAFDASTAAILPGFEAPKVFTF